MTKHQANKAIDWLKNSFLVKSEDLDLEVAASTYDDMNGDTTYITALTIAKLI